jgi:hypothetical protein
MYVLFNKHDAEAYAALCTENFEFGDGSIKGREAQREVMAKHWEIQKNVQYEVTGESSIFFVAPNVAMYRHRDEQTGRIDADGKPVLQFKRAIVRVFAKEDGKWLQATYFFWVMDE